MTSILKTPEHPIVVAKPTDIWDKVRAAADKVVEARKRAARVGRQIGFEFHHGSRAPGNADGLQSFDELRKATVDFNAALAAWMQLQAPLGPKVPPMPVEQSIVVAPMKTRMPKPLVASVGVQPNGLWPEPDTRWLTGITNPRPTHVFHHRFLFPRPGNTISNLWVGATNGHVLTALAVAQDIVWPREPGVPEAPGVIAEELLGELRRHLAGDYEPGKLMPAQQIKHWAPRCHVKGDDVEASVEPGTIFGIDVNRRLVRAAIWRLDDNATVAVFVDKKKRCVRIDANGFQASIMGRIDVAGEARGPELIA
jgi:hypothetical protein